MDFGLDKFIEMFEARFGKRATTMLLALIGVGIASAMLHTIYRDVLFPVYRVILSFVDTGAFNAVSKWAKAITKNQVIAASIEMVLLFVCTNIYYNRVKYYAIDSVKKLVMDDPQKFMEMLSERIHAEVDKVIAAQAESTLSPAPQLPPTETSPQKSPD